MDQQPLGRPPSQAYPAVGRGRNALTLLGGGVLVLAVAGGAWALFGRDDTSGTVSAIGPLAPTSAPANPVFGPVAVGTTPKPAVTPTSTTPAVTAAPAKVTPAPVKAAPAKAAPAVAAVTAGAVAQRDYRFPVNRGDTLWDVTRAALRATGRSATNTQVAGFVTKLYAHNRAVVGTNPNLIVPGETIVWPTGL